MMSFSTLRLMNTTMTPGVSDAHRSSVNCRALPWISSFWSSRSAQGILCSNFREVVVGEWLCQTSGIP